jgi:hypothetical protein
MERIPGGTALPRPRRLITVLSRIPSGPKPPCSAGFLKNFMETAAFGCPSARAAVLPLAQKFSAEMTDRLSGGGA